MCNNNMFVGKAEPPDGWRKNNRGNVEAELAHQDITTQPSYVYFSRDHTTAIVTLIET